MIYWHVYTYFLYNNKCSYRKTGYGCQQMLTYFFSPSKFSLILCREWGWQGNLSVMASRRGNSLCLPLAHYDSSLISQRGNQPPHEFGHCSPLGLGQAFFYKSTNDAKIFFSVINLINILIMTWGWQSNQIVRHAVTGPHPPPLVISSLRFLELSSGGLGLLISAGPILKIISCVS